MNKINVEKSMLQLNVNGEEFCAKSCDPDDIVNAISQFLDSLANQSWFEEYQETKIDYSDSRGMKICRKISESIMDAIVSFRLSAYEGLEKWQNELEYVLSDIYKSEVVCDEFAAIDAAINDCRINDIVNSILESVEELDDPVEIDEDELHSSIRVYLEDKLYENDTSSAKNAMRSIRIPLLYLPGVHSASDSLDRFDLDTSIPLNEQRVTDSIKSLVKLTGLSPANVFENLEIDPQSTEIIDDWLAFIDEESMVKREPVINLEDLETIFDNSSGHSCIPCWSGDVSIEDFFEIDPKKPFTLKGGVLGMLNYTSGSGYVDSFQGQIVVRTDEVLIPYRGFSIKEIFDFTQRTLNADMANLREVEPNQAKPIVPPCDPQFAM